MSQTETILLVVLGFSLAALIALFIGRFVWSLGLRLGARRMQKQVPSTVAGLQTERDRLRAEYAMLSQRLGTRLEQVKLKAAEQMAEVTRHRNRLEIQLTQLDEANRLLAARDAELAEMRQKIAALEDEARTGSERIEALVLELANRDRELAGLRQSAMAPRAAAVEPEILPPDSAANDPQDRLRARIEQLTSLSRAIAEGSHTPQPAPAAPDPALARGLASVNQETADLQKELERLDAEWSRKLEELGEPGSPATEGKTRAVANVISLANRIRALKGDIAK